MAGLLSSRRAWRRIAHVSATLLVVVALVVVPTIILGLAGLRTGDAMCTETGGGIPDFSCVAPVLGGFVIGGLAGLLLGTALAVWAVRRLRVRWRAPSALDSVGPSSRADSQP